MQGGLFSTFQQKAADAWAARPATERSIAILMFRSGITENLNSSGRQVLINEKYTHTLLDLGRVGFGGREGNVKSKSKQPISQFIMKEHFENSDIQD